MPLKTKKGRKHNQSSPPFLDGLKPSTLSMSSMDKHWDPRKEGKKYTDLIGSECSCWKHGHLEELVAFWAGQVYFSDRISPESSIFHLNLPSMEEFHSSSLLTPCMLVPSPAPYLERELALMFPFLPLRRFAIEII